jgi:DNA-directed RNA polymerase specialized sigma24 family protein
MFQPIGDSLGEVSTVSDRLLAICTRAGLARHDAEDVVQDTWLWLLQNRPLLAGASPRWLEAVAWNFIKRQRRRNRRQRARELPILFEAVDTLDLCEALEQAHVLDVLASRCRDRERQLLALIRVGYTARQGGAIARIPLGSRAYLTRLLVRRGRAIVSAANRARLSRGAAATPSSQ